MVTPNPVKLISLIFQHVILVSSTVRQDNSWSFKTQIPMSKSSYFIKSLHIFHLHPPRIVLVQISPRNLKWSLYIWQVSKYQYLFCCLYIYQKNKKNKKWKDKKSKSWTPSIKYKKNKGCCLIKSDPYNNKSSKSMDKDTSSNKKWCIDISNKLSSSYLEPSDILLSILFISVFVSKWKSNSTLKNISSSKD